MFDFRESWTTIIRLAKPVCYGAVAGGALCVGAVVAYRVAREIAPLVLENAKQFLRTKCLEYVVAETYDGCSPRTTFSNMPMTQVSEKKNHTHAHAAGERTAANSFMETFAYMMGRVPYFIQKSNANNRRNLSGSRTWFWGKDVTTPAEYYEPPRDSVRILTDTDHYLEYFPTMLATEPAIYMLYTLQPTSVCAEGENYSFTFDANNRVDYRVSGGEKFLHKVWNFSHASLSVTHRAFGIPYRTTVYLVERKVLDPHHHIVMLVPIKHFRLLGAWLASLLEAPSLKRYDVVRGKHTRLQCMRGNRMFVSTGVVNGYACLDIPVSQDTGFTVEAEYSKNDIPRHRIISQTDMDDSSIPVYWSYLMSVTNVKPDYVVAPENSAHHYQVVDATFESYQGSIEPVKAMTPFMAPIIPGACVPLKCPSNDRAMVKGRITSIANRVDVSSRMRHWCFLFVKQFSRGHVHFDSHLHPVDYEYVYERMSRPNQRAILERSDGATPHRVCESFMKAESYDSIKDPRVISTINGVDKRDYSRYTYALSAYVAAYCPWYAFSKSPKDTAARVAHICSGANSVTLSDFSRMDGRINNFMREFERILMLDMFSKCYHAEIIDLLNSQQSLKGYTRYGIKYQSKEARLSGSPETSIFNSIDNAFIAFCSFMQLGYSDTEAYNRLGIYGGDDGVTANISTNDYTSVAKKCGQELTCDVRLRGQSVKFLARIYGPDVWHGGLDSMCDIPRQLLKFHLTTRNLKEYTPEELAYDKAMAYIQSDANTPVIGQLCRRILDLTPVSSRKGYRNLEGRWTWENPLSPDSKYDDSTQYPNDVASWAMEEFTRVLPDFDYVRFKTHCLVHDLTGFLRSMPLCMPEKELVTKVEVLVNDELIKPKPLSLRQKKNRRRKRRAAGGHTAD
jgi:hypothetical protein